MAFSKVVLMQEESFVRFSTVRGGGNSYSMIRPKLHYNKEYVDSTRVFNRKLVFEVWNVSDFFRCVGGGGSKLLPFP